MIVHVGLDLSRRRLDYCLLDERGERLEVGAAAQKVKGLAPLACKTDRIDAWVLAEPEKLPGWGGQSPPSLRMPSGREGLRA